MKNTKSSLLMLAIGLSALSTVTIAHADKGGSSGGGGDIQCDGLIQGLSFLDPKGNLESWLQNDGPEKQNPKLDLSSSLNPDSGKSYTAQEYEEAMISLIERFKKAPDVNCVRPGDKGYPVDINDRSKICKTFVDKSGVRMTCDRALFMALSADQQIEQDHHEFAINVPGLEPDTGSISSYAISTQLSKSIKNVTERRLVVASPESQINSVAPGLYATYSNYCGYFVQTDHDLLILTAVDNAFGKPCGKNFKGMILAFSNSNGTWQIDLQNSTASPGLEIDPTLSIEALDNGNFIMTGFDETKATYINISMPSH